MLIDIALTAAVLIGLGLLLYGFWSLLWTGYLRLRDRRDRAPLDAALKRLGDNVKARNKRVAERIEDTF